jgi:hypothetical protein
MGDAEDMEDMEDVEEMEGEVEGGEDGEDGETEKTEEEKTKIYLKIGLSKFRIDSIRTRKSKLNAVNSLPIKLSHLKAVLVPLFLYSCNCLSEVGVNEAGA